MEERGKEGSKEKVKDRKSLEIERGNDSIIKNVSFLYVGEFLSQIMTFLLVIVISKKLGDYGFGKYSFAFSFVSLMLILADFGLQTHITKDIASKNRGKGARVHLSKTFTLKFILNIIVFIVTIVIALMSDRTRPDIMLIALAGIAMNIYYLAGMQRSILQGFELIRYEAIAKIAERTVAFGLGASLLLNGYGIFSLMIVLVLSNAVYYSILSHVVRKKVGKASMDIDVDFWKSAIKASMPFWLTIIFTNIYFRIDTIMLAYMRGFAETGWYNSAYKIIDVFTKVPFLLVSAVFPAMARLHSRSNKAEVENVYKSSIYYLVALGMPITFGLFMLSEKIIMLAFGPQFHNGVFALKVLCFALFLMFVNYMTGYLLNSINEQKLFTVTVGITTLLNIGLNLVMIPKWGYMGAAYATVASELANFAMLSYLSRKKGFFVNYLRIVWRPFIASAAMAFFIILFNVFVLYSIAASAVVYFAILFIIGGLKKEDIALIKGIFRKS